MLSCGVVLVVQLSLLHNQQQQQQRHQHRHPPHHGSFVVLPTAKEGSAVCFTLDSKAVVVGHDKFGDVWVEVVRDAESRESGEASCDRIFGHFCSTVTGACSGCGTYIATGDRDGKVRVTCLGQTEREAGDPVVLLRPPDVRLGLRFLFAGRELRLATCPDG